MLAGKFRKLYIPLIAYYSITKTTKKREVRKDEKYFLGRIS